MNITPYLDDLENRIDIETEDQLYSQWKDFVNDKFSEGIFSPKRSKTNSPKIDWPEIRINETLNDTSKMAVHQFKVCSDMLKSGTNSLMWIRSNYGTGITASTFGAEIFVMPDETNTLPTNKALSGGKEAIKKIIEAGVPTTWKSYAAKALETAEYYEEIMKPYPKIKRYVHHIHPDLQGPMDNCELLWGSDLFLDFYDEPELIKKLLDLLTDTYISFMKDWLKIVPVNEIYNVHWGMLFKGFLMLRDDSAMNLSPQLYEEYIKPYNQKIYDAFGGGADHYCGRGDHFIKSLSTIKGLNAVNLSQPELNDMEVIFANTIDKNIKIVGLNPDFAKQGLAGGRDLRGKVHCF